MTRRAEQAKWRSEHLSNILDTVIDYRGLSVPKSEIGVPLITARNVREGTIDFTVREFIEESAYGVWAKRGLPISGDVLFTTEAPLGNVALFPSSGRFAIGQRVVALRPLPGLMDARYLLQFLLSPVGKKRIDLFATGSTAKGISSGQLHKLLIDFPPLLQQEKIASALSVWDTSIEKTARLIATKLRRNEVLSNRLLFGHARFGQRNTKAIRALHWFSAPSDWQVVEIGKVAREVSTLNGNDKALPFLSCTKYDGLVDSRKYFDKKIFSHDSSKSKIVRRGQFAYATNHIEEGSIGYQDLVPAGLVSPIYTVFQTDGKKVDDGYLYKLLKTEKLRQIFAANTNASVDRRGSLRWKEFARIHIPLPSLDEQREIDAVLDDAKREIALLQAEVTALKQQKRGLMQKLLTGQWRVPVEANEVAA